MLTTPMKTNRNCLLSQEQGTEQCGKSLGLLFILFHLSLLEKRHFSCFENTLTDRCRTIQGAPVSGETFLKTEETIYLYSLLSEIITGLISACLPQRPAFLCLLVCHAGFHFTCDFYHILFTVSGHFFEVFTVPHRKSCTLWSSNQNSSLSSHMRETSQEST